MKNIKGLIVLAIFILALNIESFGQKTFVATLSDSSGAYYLSGKVSANKYSEKCKCEYIQALLIQQALPGRMEEFRGNAISFWGTGKGYEHYKESKYIIQVACKSKLMRTISAADYDDAGKTLNLKERKGDDIDWINTTTDVSAKTILDCACNLNAKNKK